MKLELELEEIYYYSREIRGLSEAIFLATNSPDSVGVHTEDALRVLLRLCDQLVDEVESRMNEKDTKDSNYMNGIRELVNSNVELTKGEIELILQFRTFDDAGKKAILNNLSELSEDELCDGSVEKLFRAINK